MIPRMTFKALEALERAMTSGDFSEGWEHECTNHPMALEGTEGFTLVADPESKDFVAKLYFGHTRKGNVLTMDVAIEKIDKGYEEQSLRGIDPYVRLVSFKVPTWTWAWGGISVLVGDANTCGTEPVEDDEDEIEECECIPEKRTVSLERWFA